MSFFNTPGQYTRDSYLDILNVSKVINRYDELVNVTEYGQYD